MSEKITGYLLLFIGIVIMAFATYRVYFVLMDQSNTLLPAPKDSQQTQTAPPSLSNLRNISAPSSDLSNPLNMMSAIPNLGNILASAALYFFLAFLLNLGFKISSLGIMLIRPINVKLKTNDVFLSVDKGTSVEGASVS